MVCDLAIRNCVMIDDQGRTINNCSVYINQGKIIAINAESSAETYEAKEVLEGEGNLLMPGFVDGHTHSCQQLLRGRTSDEYPMIWTRFLVPFESNLTPENVRAGARLFCLEMIKSGITCFADAGGVHMEEVAEAVIESGMRGVLCRSSMDIKDSFNARLCESTKDTLDNGEKFYKAYNGKGEDRVRVFFGLRQVMNCSPELVESTGELARRYNTGIHAHLCEHKDEVKYCLQKYKMRPAEFLDHMKVLGPNLLTAHNVLLSSHDIHLMSEKDVKVIHCPTANLSNHGFPKAPEIMERGLHVGLGCDGGSSVPLDMFNEMRVLKYGMVSYFGLPIFDPKVMTNQTLLMLSSEGGAQAVGQPEEIGRIEVGKKADLIIIDIHEPHIRPNQNLLNAVVMCANGNDVKHTIIDGKVVMKNRVVLTLDEEKVKVEAEENMNEVIKVAKFDI